MNNKNSNNPLLKRSLFWVIAGILVFASCKKLLPQDRDTIGADSKYTQVLYEPILGRTTVFTNTFYAGSTNYPATFKIVSPKRYDGSVATELDSLFPVLVWKSTYNGLEKSLADIEAKREYQLRPLFEINEHSGGFTMWAAAHSSTLRAQADSGYLFDVELSNSGGRRYFKNLKLKPFRERAYEPSTNDPITGQSVSNGTYLTYLQSVKGVNTGLYLANSDIDVYIRKRYYDGNTNNSITFKFLDTLYKPFNPSLFSNTNWAGLLHGFNMQMTDSSVTYNVAFPVPLTALPTRYTTSDGTRASVVFGYPRLGFGGTRDDGAFGLDFAIYEPGDWEIIFAFKKENPKFVND